MNVLVSFLLRHAAWLAAALIVLAAVSADGIDGYSHLQHPLALLGARPLRGVALFNLLAFVVPGLLAAWVAWELRAAMSRAGVAEGRPLPWAARLGAQLMLLSALAFAAQGLFPLDLDDLDGVGSGRHAAAWLAWWLACALGAVSLGYGLLRHGPSDGVARWRALGWASLAAGVLVPALAVLPHGLPPGLAQRLALAAWLAWTGYAVRASRVVLSRSAT